MTNKFTLKQQDQQLFDRLEQVNWGAISDRLVEQAQLDVKQIPQAIQKSKKLLFLSYKYPHLRLVPNLEIDAVIHALIDSISPSGKNALENAGLWLKHLPGLGTRGNADRQQWLTAFRLTCNLFERHFGHGAMGDSMPACCEILEQALC